ncbi:TPA: Tat pathway signal sequence protein, partial [Escherichia coli]|nr:Tat pathway signal sequence protein [Escherichia coli]HAJ2603392.1 Tat pathway signal sequence protein [Escherichia coli]HAJ2623842.1 Tat pathway signal sequence protein [Escherichia coli]
MLRTTVLAGEVIIQENNRMLKRRDAFLKKSALAVSVALL